MPPTAAWARLPPSRPGGAAGWGGAEDFGALNLYVRRPRAFTEDIDTDDWLLASHAAVALSSTRLRRLSQDHNVKLRDVVQHFRSRAAPTA
ncbi:hypothetical protein STVIR_8178 [Streptomyces viridochromogenes Tue57]|uniref:Uncharacterized protein n=1 Tax=Streptomyces viridochromogenes Tue57 TaxID=1160705 RepID=L8P314_STRVR|nr:hypothetical protein STVIR_8178 [Streptomyces viridochromogenes Tue57]